MTLRLAAESSALQITWQPARVPPLPLLLWGLEERASDALSIIDDLENRVRNMFETQAVSRKALRQIVNARDLERHCFWLYSKCRGILNRVPAEHRNLIAAELVGIHLRLVGCSNLLSRLESRWRARRQRVRRSGRRIAPSRPSGPWRSPVAHRATDPVPS